MAEHIAGVGADAQSLAAEVRLLSASKDARTEALYSHTTMRAVPSVTYVRLSVVK